MLFLRSDSNIVYIDGVAPPTSPSSNTSSDSSSPSNANANEEVLNESKSTSSYTDWMSWKNVNKSVQNKNKQTCPPTLPSTTSTSSMVGFGGKLNTNHHLKLLQTIREQDEGESR